VTPPPGVSRTGPLPVSLLALMAALLLLLALSAPAGAAVRVQITQTKADLTDALTAKKARRFVAAPRSGAAVITVNPGVRYQRILGFGAAMTDTSAWLLYDELSPAARASTMAALFSRAGIHLSFVHIPMAASDFTANGTPYTYDDMPAGESDPSMEHFSIAHDEPYVMPALQQMLSLNREVFTLADPWTAPPWMKANGLYNNLHLAGTVLPQYYPALAQYFVRFIEAYEARGVPIDAISMMNEPNSLSSWPGTALTAADQTQFLPQYLAPALQGAGLRPGVFGLDGTDLNDARTLLDGTGNVVTGVAFHCYKGMAIMSRLHAEYPSRTLLVSECSPGISRYAAAEAAIAATRNWAAGVQLWNLALDPAGGPVQAPNGGCGGCTGLVTVDEQTHTATFGRTFYQLGQISKYVQPGAARIFSTRPVSDFTAGARYGVTPGVDDVAFVNPDGSKVLVAYNNTPQPSPIAVKYRGRFLNWALPGGATVTFRWR
jgi:glucosylceramidase